MQKVLWRIAVGFLTIGLLLGAREIMLRPDDRMHVVFLDIGQGDSTLITFRDGSRMLIDGGPDWTTLEKLGERLPFFDRDIDIVALSHPHVDHLMSLTDVIRRYRVKSLVTAGWPDRLGPYRAMLSGAELRGTKILELQAGATLTIADATIRVLWPPRIRPPGMAKDPNNNSLTLMLEEGGKRILFPGDLESISERTLAAAKADLKADVLKVTHHGSNGSSSTGFILAVDPDIAVISSGTGNSFGHPGQAAMRRLETLGAEIRRTDKEGDIEIVW